MGSLYLLFVVLVFSSYISEILGKSTYSESDLEEARGELEQLNTGIEDVSDYTDIRCSNVLNVGAISASSEYSYYYSASNAIKGIGFAWSSDWFFSSVTSGPWLDIVFVRKKNVTALTMRGDANYPDNTPTKFQLQGLSEDGWVVLKETEQDSADNEEISDRIPSELQNTYEAYKLVVIETKWMRHRSSFWGYAEVSTLKLCWK